MSTKVFKDRWVNFWGDAKSGDGKFAYLSGDDQGEKAGFIFSEKAAKGISKGAKVTVKARKDGKQWKVVGVKLLSEARSGGGGGSRTRASGGKGYDDPKRQQSIVMQHSQSAAIELLGKGANIAEVLQTAVVLFSQAYGPGLDAAVAAAAELELEEAFIDVDTSGDDFEDDEEDSSTDDDDDFDDDFDD